MFLQKAVPVHGIIRDQGQEYRLIPIDSGVGSRSGPITISATVMDLTQKYANRSVCVLVYVYSRRNCITSLISVQKYLALKMVGYQ